MVQIVDFNDVSNVLNQQKTLFNQALSQNMVGRGQASAVSPDYLKYSLGQATVGEKFEAAFLQENILVSWLSRITPNFKPQEGFNNSAEHKEMLGYYEQYVDQFPELMNAQSPQELVAIQNKIRREIENRAVLENVGFFEGLLYYLPAGILSPENLLPFATAIRGMGIGAKSVGALSASRAAAIRSGVYEVNPVTGSTVLTAAAQALTKKQRKALLVRAGIAKNTLPQIAGLSAIEGAVAGGVAEIILNAQQGLRTKEEMIMGVVGGAVFGGILGTGATVIGKTYRNQLNKVIGYEYLSDAVNEANASYSRALVEKLKEHDVDVVKVLNEIEEGIEGDELLKAQKVWEESIESVEGEIAKPIRALAGFENEDGWLNSILKKITWLNPNLKLAISKSDRVKALGEYLVADPLIRTKNRSLEEKGLEVRPSIESMIHLVELDAFVKIQSVHERYLEYKKSGGKLNENEFNQLLGRLHRRGGNFDRNDILDAKEDGSLHFPGAEKLDPSDVELLKKALIDSSKPVDEFFQIIKELAMKTGAFTRVKGEEAVGNIIQYFAREYDIDKIKLDREVFVEKLMDGRNRRIDEKRIEKEQDIVSLQHDIMHLANRLQRATNDADRAILQEQVELHIDAIREINKEIEGLELATREKVESTIDKILGDASRNNSNPDSGTVSARIKNFLSRELDISDEVLEDFLISDADYIMGKMIRHTLPDLLLSEYLGHASISKLLRSTEARIMAVNALHEKYVADPTDANAKALLEQMDILRNDLNKLNLSNALRTAPKAMQKDLQTGLNQLLGITENQLTKGIDQIAKLFDNRLELQNKLNDFSKKIEDLNMEMTVSRVQIENLVRELTDDTQFNGAMDRIKSLVDREELEQLHKEDVEEAVASRLEQNPEYKLNEEIRLGNEEVSENIGSNVRNRNEQVREEVINTFAKDIDIDPPLEKIDEIAPEQTSTPIVTQQQLNFNGNQAVEKIYVGISAYTDTIEGLARLGKKVAENDLPAIRTIQYLAENSLEWLFSAIEKARPKYKPAFGLYGDVIEPSQALEIEIDLNDTQTLNEVLGALSQFAKMFNQEQVHVRTKKDSNTGPLHEYSDGSYNTEVSTIELNRDLTKEELDKIRSDSGVAGFTVTDKRLQAYYVDEKAELNEKGLSKFREQIEKAKQIIGDDVKSSTATTERLYVYGKGGTWAETHQYASVDNYFRAPSKDKANASVLMLAKLYVGGEVVPFKQAKNLTEDQKEFQVAIKDAYDDMKLNNLDDPNVRRAYEELAAEILSQWKGITAKIEIYKDFDSGEPYAGSKAMRQDMNTENHLFIYQTIPDQFGPSGVVYDDHPLLRPAIIDGKQVTDINGEPLLINDVFRAVHDYYAHGLSTAQFGVLGEEAAWSNHMATIKSPWAMWALTSETRGQNSWYNFSDANKGKAHKDKQFAEQKVDLLPLEFLLTGNSAIDTKLLELPISDELRSLIESRYDPVQPHVNPAEYIKDQHRRSTNENILSDGLNAEAKESTVKDSRAERQRAKNRAEKTREMTDVDYLLGAVDELLTLTALPEKRSVEALEKKGIIPGVARKTRLANHVEAEDGELIQYSVVVDKNGAIRRKAMLGDKKVPVSRKGVKTLHNPDGTVEKIPAHQSLSIISYNGKYRYVDETELNQIEFDALLDAIKNPDLSEKAKKKITEEIAKKSKLISDVGLNTIPARTLRSDKSEIYFESFLDFLEQNIMMPAPEGSGKLFQLRPEYRDKVRDTRQGVTRQGLLDDLDQGDVQQLSKDTATAIRSNEEIKRKTRQKVERELSLDNEIKQTLEDYIVGGESSMGSRQSRVSQRIAEEFDANGQVKNEVDSLVFAKDKNSLSKEFNDLNLYLNRLLSQKTQYVNGRKIIAKKRSDVDQKLHGVSRILKRIKGGSGHTPIQYNYHSRVKTDGHIDDGKLSSAIRGLIGATNIIRRNSFRDQVSLQPHLDAIDVEYKKLIKNATTTKAVGRLEKDRDKEKFLIETIVSRMRNTDGFDGDIEWQKASRILRNFNYLRSMGGVVISSIPDIVMGISTAGFGNYARAMAKGLRREWTERGSHRDEMAMLLWAGETVLGRNRAASVFDIEQPYNRTANPDLIDKIDYKLGQASNSFSRYSATNWWNGMMKSVSAVAIQSRIIQVSKKKLLGQSISKSDQAFMNFIGMNDQVARDVAKIHESLTDVSDDFMGHTFYYSGMDRWNGTMNGVSESRVKYAREMFRSAVRTGVNNTVLTPNAGVLPPTLTTWYGRMLGQFRSFMLQSTETLAFSGSQRLLAAKDINQLITVFGLTFMGTLVYALKEGLMGRDALADLDDEKNLRKLLFNGMDRGGALAMPMEINNVIHSLAGGGGPINKLFGVSEEAGRYRQRDFFSTISAPAGVVEDAVKGLVSLTSRGLDPDEELNKGDRTRLRRLLPFQNLWWLSVGLDVVPNLLGGSETYFDSNYRIEERLYGIVGGQPQKQKP